MITDQQKQSAQAIINIFETSKVLGDYTSVVFVAGDPGGLTYGRSQTTLMSGNLYLLIKAYCEAKEAGFADELNIYIDRLKAIDSSLNKDKDLRNILQNAGHETVMQDVQDAFFDRVYWMPAVKNAEAVDVETPLGIAVVYDSTVHGSWKLISDRTVAEFGKVSKIGEKIWISKYVDVRRDWLANHPTVPLLHKTVYRMDAFKKLITEDKWELQLPFTVRGLLIDEETLTPNRSGSAQIDEVRLLRLQSPFMRGEDVRQVQEALKVKGFTIKVDDVYGANTELLVKEFQKQQKMKADGIVGAATRAALGL